MAKKRKARQAAPSGPREVDPADARLKVTTYEDIVDSEEEYFINKDRIDFDDEPRSKRQRRLEDEEAFLELSDEEVLADSGDSEDESDGGGPVTKAKSSVKHGLLEDEADDAQGDEDERDSGWWGSSKKEYYDADNIETEADALEEEAEARKLQQKKLAKMSEADFMFDEQEWLAPAADATGDDEVVTEALKDAPVTEDMTPEERYKLLQARYPELDYLADEFRTLQPLLDKCREEAAGKPSKSLEVVKYWVLGSYVASLASYFAILTSPARDKNGVSTTMDPAELRDHDIMETLMNCRETWLKVKKLQSSSRSADETGMLSPPDEDLIAADNAEVIPEKTFMDKAALKQAKALKKKKAEKAKQAQAIEDSLADLSTLLQGSKKAIKAKPSSQSQESRPNPAAAAADDDDNDDKRSDFGEEDTIDARTAADKAQRKKSLRFYTSQIVQKANRRAGAGRDAGGDTDIPHRERLRDRQARLLAEAERRGRKDSKYGTNLGEEGSGDDDDDDGGDGGGGKPRDLGDEYYDMVASASRQKKDDKAARQAALAKAKKDERVVEEEVVGEDGKRKVTYRIMTNKGITQNRRKEVRNPRVKKKMQYGKKQQKLQSMRAVYKGGEGRGGYQGELSGIRTGLVKSVKL